MSRDSAVHGLGLDRFSDHFEGFSNARAFVGKHVAEIVENHGVVRIDLERLAEVLLGRLIVLLAFSEAALQEEKVELSSFLVVRDVALFNASSASFQRCRRV